MKKTIFFSLFAGLYLMVSWLLSHGAAQQMSEKELRKTLVEWLDSPIAYIISPKEKSAYMLKLKHDKTEELLRYIEYFWRRRDPDLSTPTNEFRDEFFRRVAHCNTRYAIGKRYGWDSQRGRVYIVFGPPSEIMKGIQSESWTYYNLPSDRIQQNFTIEFIDVRGNNDYRISGTKYPGKDKGEAYMEARLSRALSNTIPREVTEGLEAINEMAVINPELKLTDISLPVLGEKPLPPEEKKIEKPERGVLSNIPFDLQRVFFRSDNSKVEIAIGFLFQPSDLGFRQKEETLKTVLNIEGELLDSRGNKVDAFQKKTEILISIQEWGNEKHPGISVWRSLEAIPGKYHINIKFEDEGNRQIQSLRAELEVPDFGGELFLGTIILASEIMSDVLQESSGEEVGILQIDGFLMKPRMNAVFSSDESLCLFFQILNISEVVQNRRSDIAVNAYIFKEEKLVHQIIFSDNNLTYPRENEAIGHFCSSLVNFDVGEYALVIQVKDKKAKKDSAKKLFFTIDPVSAD